MRRLIICADGTWNHPDEETDGVETPTNVIKMARAILPVDSRGISQITYYHAGVGTHDKTDKFFGGAFGRGLDTNIRNCYRFLVHNYVPGDELYFFGFSRGAYTVRSLTGFIRNSGLLKAVHADQEDEAFALYRNRDDATHPNGDEASRFRTAYASDPVPIMCIGVWDTVGALGLPVDLFRRGVHEKYQFHDVTLSSRVKNAFHALAIDEQRKPFAPTLWEQPIADRGTNWLEQAWFAGVHSDVGGGYPDSSLSDIALDWMVKRVRARCGLEVDGSYLAACTKPSPSGALHNSMQLVYKALGPLVRRIAEHAVANAARGVSTWEYVHESVQHRIAELKRLSDMRPYQPQNLTTYMGRQQPLPLFAIELLDPSLATDTLGHT